MVLLRASTEFLADLFTPGVFSPAVVTKGLPEGCNLVNVEIDKETGIATLYYDDGKEEETVVKVQYSAVIRGVESV
jgi:hypothetical protein